MLVATAAGQPFDKYSNKNTLYACKDAVVALGYTGMAFLGNVPTDQWLVQVITDDRLESKPALIRPTSWTSHEGLGQTLKRIRAALEVAQKSVRFRLATTMDDFVLRSVGDRLALE